MSYDASEGEKFFSQEGNDSSATLKVGPTIQSRAHPGDIHKETDSEGMCVQE